MGKLVLHYLLEIIGRKRFGAANLSENKTQTYQLEIGANVDVNKKNEGSREKNVKKTAWFVIGITSRFRSGHLKLYNKSSRKLFFQCLTPLFTNFTNFVLPVATIIRANDLSNQRLQIVKKNWFLKVYSNLKSNSKYIILLTDWLIEWVSDSHSIHTCQHSWSRAGLTVGLVQLVR